MIKSLMRTSKGYTVSGCMEAFNPRINNYSGYSGRVRVINDDPSQDEIVKWTEQMQPVDHDYGALVPKQGVEHEEVNGFNLMSGLKRR